MNPEMRHISDTALLVAAARASGTRCHDCLVQDPYAQMLAGKRGLAIWENFKGTRWMSFGIGLRSCFIDEFLKNELEACKIDRVISMGAGLDARPWRLNVPSDLRWIEVDFAPILEYKYEVLTAVTPRCRLE